MIQDIMEHYGYVSYLHPALLFVSRLAVLVIIVFLIVVLGFVAQRILFKWLINLMHKLFLKIPIVKSIYRITTEIIKPLFSPGAKPFKKTVALDFPHEDARALGFLTGDVPESMEKPAREKKGDSDLKSVFLPTAPHPISGFLLITSQSKLEDIDISIEDVFKILVSCGTYHPGKQQGNTGNDSDSKAT